MNNYTCVCGDFRQRPKMLSSVYEKHGILPPENSEYVIISDSDDESSDECDPIEYEDLTRTRLSSMDLNALPEPIRKIADKAPSPAIIDNLLEWKLAELPSFTFGSPFKANYFLGIVVRHCARTAKCVIFQFLNILKYGILFSFVFRSAKYFYLNMYQKK